MNDNLPRFICAITIAMSISVSVHAVPVIDLDSAEEFTPLIVASNNPYKWIAPTPSILDGVGKLTLNRTDGSFGCSGSLLEGGGFMITAAHCVTDDEGNNVLNFADVSFQGGAVTTTASQAYIWSGWDGSTVGVNNDIAILKLDTAVNSIDGYEIATTEIFGSVVMHAGYGLTGTGSSGAHSGTFGTLHFGFNVYDAIWGGGSLAYDFDDGTAAHDAFCIAVGICGVGLSYPNESMIAPGDSGGGSFIWEGGEFKLVGVHSFAATFGLLGGDIDNFLNSSFGEASGDTHLLPYLAWIDAVTAVPEPQTYLRKC